MFWFINFLTLLRLPLSILAYGELRSQKVCLISFLLLFLMIAMTDILDGKLARAYHLQSRFGAIADVLCDFFYIIMASYALYQLQLLPLWMLILMTLKLLEFILTSTMMPSQQKKIFHFDVIGRWVAIGFYLLPAIIVIFYYLMPNKVFWLVQQMTLAVLLFFALISIFQRVKKLVTC